MNGKAERGGLGELAGHLDLGLVLVGSDRKIRDWNRWIERAADRSFAAAHGRAFFDVFAEARGSRLEQAVDDALDLGLSSVLTHALHGRVLRMRHPQDRHGIDHTIRVRAHVNAAHPSARSCLIQVQDLTASVRREAKLRSMQKELIAARDHAEAASSARATFLATMSHELRTPMSAILGFADMLAEDISSGIDQAVALEHVEGLRRNARQLLGLVNDVLDLSKLDAGAVELELLPVDLGQTLQDLQALLMPLARARDLEFVIDVDVPRGRVMLDELRFRQVLTNLIGNAIKFTVSGSVRVETGFRAGVRGVDDSLTVRVTDTGIGMSDEQAAIAFEPFLQGDSSISRRFGGTGLGLAISRNLVRVMGGELELVSHDGGCVLEFTIPVQQLAGPRATVEPRPTTTTSSFAGMLSDARVLVAEDGEDIRYLIQRVLGRAGAKVEFVEDGEQLLQRVQGRPGEQDVIIVDMHMPRVSGYEAVERMRQDGLRTPVLALTASSVVGDRQRCIDAGCDEYLTKPVDWSALVPLLAGMIVRDA